MLAIRASEDGEDYHVMKRTQDGTWIHKPGTSAILEYRGEMSYDVSWISEGYGKYGWEKGIREYTGEIAYIVYS